MTTTPQEALKAALDALKANHQHQEDYDEYGGYPESSLQDQNFAAMGAIERALAALSQQAAQEQQPVAWVRFRSDGGIEGPILDSTLDDIRRKSGAWTALYAAAPAKPADPLQSLADQAQELDMGYGKPAEREKAQACPNCGGSGRTWKCTCTPIWPGYVDSFSQQAPSLTMSMFANRADYDAAAAQQAPSTAAQEEMYFLQDKRSFVGNCPMWWAEDGNGYTTRIDKAHRYTKEQAFAQNKCRGTDIPWPCSVVDPLQRPTIDMQDLHKTDYFKSGLAHKGAQGEKA